MGTLPPSKWGLGAILSVLLPTSTDFDQRRPPLPPMHPFTSGNTQQSAPGTQRRINNISLLIARPSTTSQDHNAFTHLRPCLPPHPPKSQRLPAIKNHPMLSPPAPALPRRLFASRCLCPPLGLLPTLALVVRRCLCSFGPHLQH